MRIADVSIKIEPGANETIEPVILKRTGKIWSVERQDGTERGLFPGEIRIANFIQEELIAKLVQHKE